MDYLSVVIGSEKLHTLSLSISCLLVTLSSVVLAPSCSSTHSSCSKSPWWAQQKGRGTRTGFFLPLPSCSVQVLPASAEGGSRREAEAALSRGSRGDGSARDAVLRAQWIQLCPWGWCLAHLWGYSDRGAEVWEPPTLWRREQCLQGKLRPINDNW